MVRVFVTSYLKCIEVLDVFVRCLRDFGNLLDFFRYVVFLLVFASGVFVR